MFVFHNFLFLPRIQRPRYDRTGGVVVIIVHVQYMHYCLIALGILG